MLKYSRLKPFRKTYVAKFVHAATLVMLNLLLMLCFTESSLAMDIAPYKVGQLLNESQAQEMQQRYKAREKQPWKEPDMDTLNNHDNAELIQYGIRVLTQTPSLIGPDVANKNMRFSGNHLSCSNCHLSGISELPGSKPFGIPFINVMNDYPNFRKRSMRIGSIEDRINGCMVRSMGNGKPLPKNSREMQGILAYFSWLAEGTKPDMAMEGTKIPNIKLPKRRSNVQKGKELFAENCISCHGEKGLGTRNSPARMRETGKYYKFPAIAGSDSFNDGAGMSRIIKATRFIYGNMPFGADADNPILSVEQAYDIAGYLLSLPRAHREGRENDFPNPRFRPRDYPVPAYFKGDKNALIRAKYGPF